jgi:hypothetical protein
MDLDFYDAGCENPRGGIWLASGLLLLRRMMRRLLRPVFLRQVEILQQIVARFDEQPRAIEAMREKLLEEQLVEFRRFREEQARATRALREELDQAIESFRTELSGLARRDDQLAERFQGVQAFGWDHVSLARRLAALEDHVEAVLAQSRADDESAKFDPTQSRIRIA